MKMVSEKGNGTKILFVYTEFINNNGESRDYRGFSELSLNFSTDMHFSYQDGVLIVNKLEKPIVSDFFGDRIYNITSLVGDNGSGKTTILHYIMQLLKKLYEGEYCENDFVLLAIEWNSQKYILEYHGKSQQNLKKTPEGFKYMTINDLGIKKLLSTTKLIYLSNTLTNSDLELVRPQPIKENDRYVNLFHFRYDFLYNCSTASLMVENCQNDSSGQFKLVSEYLKCFFLYEQYKQIKYVFDKRQYDILKELEEKNYPVPVPKQLTIELQCVDYYEIFGEQFFHFIEKNILGEVYLKKHKRLIFELCSSCVAGFYKTVQMYAGVRTQIYWENLLKKGVGFERTYYIKDEVKFIFFKTLEQICIEFNFHNNSKNDREFMKNLYENCVDFINFIYDQEKNIAQYFEIESVCEKVEKKERAKILFSIKTTGKPAEWFINFLQKYRYTCEPYYYLNFHWGLSSGEQNLLRMFSSLYYIFDADFTNPNRGEYTIYNNYKGKKVSCDSIILFLDEADLTYHPEWQRHFISILVAFLPKIYPKTSCSNIQIVLTTHSPLMLGDLPAQSVIYLYKNSDGQFKIDDKGCRQTFGENLYTLLQTSFSVQNGAIGELVRMKIEEILQTLKVLKKDISSWSKEKPSYNKINNYICKLKSYKKGTIAFLADGIIKAKLCDEVDCCLQELNKISLQYNREFSSFSELSNIELQYQLNAISKELERRKDDLQ